MGYGKYKADGKMILAHRYLWEQVNGKIPIGLYLLHKCDVTSCVNPNHLFLGTPKDNMVDMARKNRQVYKYGEENVNSKLNEKKVKEIRALYRKGDRQYGCYGLAKIYGVRPGTIWKVVANKQWKIG